ncbi:hypothetical protein Q763_14435 [Flavobacterium beibuense F44-8]|uniref:Peptidoglycan hydrolase n=1 Tax=Flavobacterium beibuense F44-8 TaxID=1406840 RepID=A0A0A2LJ24_9FLAO|nr:glucosaminidase domain-containing protein [Flavobacterium beibuense]KGO79236.1 hypothetical protein Q763_14435 [Flavobacterium beibuense F44-8]
MMKKILVLFLLGLVASCGSHKSRIQTTKDGTAKHRKKDKKSRSKISTTDSRKATASNSSKIETLESSSKTVVYADVVSNYINTFKSTAEDNMRRHGIPASITLAQGILESGAGRGTLCVTANNHFGIKCHTDWDGDKVYHDDDAKGECFRKYDDPAGSYEDHSLFLTTRKRYASLFELDPDDYKGWAHGLKKAGYATDPKYPNKLIDLIERYNLDAFDAEVLGKKGKHRREVEKEIEKNREGAVAQTSSPSRSSKTYKVMQGDTLYSISKKHNLTVDELKKLNDLSSNAISIGQILKVK